MELVVGKNIRGWQRADRAEAVHEGRECHLPSAEPGEERGRQERHTGRACHARTTIQDRGASIHSEAGGEPCRVQISARSIAFRRMEYR